MLRKGLPAFAVLALMGGILLAYGDLHKPSLARGDEALTALRSVGMMRQGHGWTPYWNGEPDIHKPPFYFWCVVGSFGLFGVNEMSVRLPSVVALLLLLGVTYRMVRWSEGSPWTGVLAAALVTCHPLTLAQSRVGMLDTMMNLFVTLGAFALLLAREQPRAYVAWGLFGALALLTKGEGASFLLPMGGLYLLLMQREAFRCRHLYIGGGLMAAIVIAWFGSEALLHRQMFLTPHYNDFVEYRLHYLWDSFRSQKTTRNLWASWGALAPLLCVSPLLLPLSVPRSRGDAPRDPGNDGRQLRFLVLCVLWICVPLLMISVVAQQMYWYCLPPVVPMACLGGILLARLARNHLRRWAPVAVSLLLIAGTFLPDAFLVHDWHDKSARVIRVVAALAAVAALALPRWPRTRTGVVCALTTIALGFAIVSGVSPDNQKVNLSRPYNAEPFRTLAQQVPARPPDAPPVVANFRHFELNSLMFYLRRDTEQLSDFSQKPMPPHTERDAVIEECDFAPFLAGLEITVVGRFVGRKKTYTVLTLRNTTDEPITPAAFHAAMAGKDAEGTPTPQSLP